MIDIPEYERLKRIIENHIINLEKTLGSTFLEEEQKPSAPTPNNFNESHNIQRCDDAFINSLLNSSDMSTQNMGEFLMAIKRIFPDLYQETVDALMSNIDKDREEVLYVGFPMDTFMLKSSVIILRNLSSKKETKEIVRKLLKYFVSDVEDRNYEFYAYYSYLMTFTREENQPKLLNLLRALSRRFESASTKEEALDNMRKLIILIDCYHLELDFMKNGACYDHALNTVYVDDIADTDGVLFHEFGHAIDYHFSTRNKNVRPTELLRRAANNIASNPKSKDIIIELNNKLIEMRQVAIVMYNNAVIKKYGSIDAAISDIEEKVVKKMDKGKLSKLLDKYLVDSETKNKILNDYIDGNVDTREVAEILYRTDQYNSTCRCIYSKGEGAFIDIITAIFGDMDICIGNETISISYGHSKEYYDSVPNHCMTEIMADINELILSGRDDLVSLLHELIGNELWEYIMKERNNGRIITKKSEMEVKIA